MMNGWNGRDVEGKRKSFHRCTPWLTMNHLEQSIPVSRSSNSEDSSHDSLRMLCEAFSVQDDLIFLDEMLLHEVQPSEIDPSDDPFLFQKEKLLACDVEVQKDRTESRLRVQLELHREEEEVDWFPELGSMLRIAPECEFLSTLRFLNRSEGCGEEWLEGRIIIFDVLRIRNGGGSGVERRRRRRWRRWR